MNAINLTAQPSTPSAREAIRGAVLLKNWAKARSLASTLSSQEAEQAVSEWLDELAWPLLQQKEKNIAPDQHAQRETLAVATAVVQAQKENGAFSPGNPYFRESNRRLLIQSAAVFDEAQSLCELLLDRAPPMREDPMARASENPNMFPDDTGELMFRAGEWGQMKALQWISDVFEPPTQNEKAIYLAREHAMRRWAMGLAFAADSENGADAARAARCQTALRWVMKNWGVKGDWAQAAQQAASMLPIETAVSTIAEFVKLGAWAETGGARVFALAASSGKMQLCEELIKLGAKTDSFWSEIHPARAGAVAMLDWLAIWGVNFQDSRRALSCAVLCQEEEAAKSCFEKILRQWGAPKKGLDAALSAAARKGRIWALDALSDFGVKATDWEDVSVPEEGKNGLLEFQHPLVEAANRTDAQAIEWLLAHGVSASDPKAGGQKAIAQALRQGRPVAAEALVDEVNAKWALDRLRAERRDNASMATLSVAWARVAQKARAVQDAKTLAAVVQEARADAPGEQGAEASRRNEKPLRRL